jgi:hypothetical protein
MRTKAISPRTFSGAPVGAFPKNGSRPGPFPWQNSPGGRGSSRVLEGGSLGGGPVLPENKKLSGTGEKGVRSRFLSPVSS